jgi:transposase
MTRPVDRAPASCSDTDGIVLVSALLAGIKKLTAQVAALSARVQELESENAALRDKLPRLPPARTSENSSLPPSQGRKANADRTSRPKSKVHAGAHRPLHPKPTTQRDVVAERCPHCQAGLGGVVQAPVHAYDRIELPEITPDVTRVTLHGGTCPCCARRFKARPPAGLEPGSPYGPNLRAFVLYLRFAQAIPFERLARLLSDLLGVTISEGALANMLADSRPAFERQTSLIRQRLLSGTLLQSDETSVRVGGKTWWTWVFHSGNSACFVVRPHRGKGVVKEFLGAFRPEVWVSDRLGAQMGWATAAHQVCLAHLLRDVQYAIDAGDVVFAPGMKKLLKQAVAIGHRRDHLTDATLVTYASRLETTLDRLLQITPDQRAGHKLQRVIKRFRQNLFVFITNRTVPPTNNGSEQALRPCVVFRKVTNGFRSEWAAALYADVRSVFETARRRGGISILRAIRLTLDGTPLPAGA